MSIVDPPRRFHGDQPFASLPGGVVDRQQLALVAMERTRMPLVICDPRLPDNPIVLANQAFVNATGYGPDEIIGRNCRFLQGPDTDPATLARIRQAIAAQEEITVELINYRKDGTTFWNQLYISPVHDDDGQLLYFFASQMDTTKRHHAEALEVAEHRLLLEVDHRAKNALALVQGIVRLTNRDKPEHFAEAVQDRVDALARAHAILADHRWSPVPLWRIIRGEIGMLGGQRIHLSGDPAELSPAQVQPVVLLLHELAVNARHHGAFSVCDGQLSVEWQNDEAARHLRIRWAESGGPAPPTARVSGYGHAMIDAIARRQLGGQINYVWADSGLVADVIIPHDGRVGGAINGCLG